MSGAGAGAGTGTGVDTDHFFASIVKWAGKNPLIVVLLTVFIVVGGGYAFSHMPIDAVPDVTNIQVQIVTRVPALSASEVETQITQPIERTMLGIPSLKEMRSITRFGISIVTLVFEDDDDIYLARALVNERLTTVRDLIPADIGRPEIAPIMTGLGEIFMFELKPTHEARTPEDLRTIVEWHIAPRLRQVPGVIDIVGFGGHMRQYKVTLDPSRLAAHGLSAQEVRQAMHRDNALAGGGYVERAGEQVVLRADARFKSLEDISQTVVKVDERGTPITVGMLGEVDTGPALRQGAMTRDGKGEVVGASVWMLRGQNSREVVHRVKKAIEDLKPSLPGDVAIEPYYDRAEFIDRVLKTVMSNLAEGAGFVVVLLLLTLGSIRAGLIVAGAIPFAMLVGFIGLTTIGYSGNVMSLGSVDFGIVVEGAVVVVEHALTHMGPHENRVRRRKALIRAMQEVSRPVVFGVIIVTLVFLPLATLEDVEGKMFRPVVFSLVFMLLGALFYALVIVPAIAPRVFRSMPLPKQDPWLMRQLHRIYDPALSHALKRPWTAITISFVAGAILLGFGAQIGAEFLPRIFEGNFALDARRPPSTSLSQAIALAGETEIALEEFPEVKTVIDRIGRPEGAVDTQGPETSDTFVILKPRHDWRPGMTPEKLIDQMSEKLNQRVPATIHAFSQPIEMRVNDLIAGVKSDLAIKVFGYDLVSMSEAANMIRRAIQQVPGSADVKMEIATGLPSVKVTVIRERASRLGIAPRDVLDIVEMARAGQEVGRVREGERVFDLTLRIGGESVLTPNDLGRLPVITSSGNLVPLAMVANVESENTVVQISRERMRRRLVVESNIRGRDLVGFVNDAQAEVAKLKLPQGIELVWGGQFQNFNRAKTRLSLLVPVALAIIAVLLVMTFQSMRYMVVTVLNLPFAVAGGAFALWLRGLPFSIPAGVGFIALCGVSVMTGVVMTTNLKNQPIVDPPDVRVKRAATQSLRPIMSTALVAAIGFVPMAIATGPGAEVQRPLATVVIFGLIAATIFSLPALPAMLLVAARNEPADDDDDEYEDAGPPSSFREAVEEVLAARGGPKTKR